MCPLRGFLSLFGDQQTIQASRCAVLDVWNVLTLQPLVATQ